MEEHWKLLENYGFNFFSLQFFPFLLCVFWSAIIRYINIEAYFVSLINLLHYHYEITFFIPSNTSLL